MTGSQRRNMQVMVKGRISHPDHKTILLRGWHMVVMNTENQSDAMRVRGIHRLIARTTQARGLNRPCRLFETRIMLVDIRIAPFS